MIVYFKVWTLFDDSKLVDDRSPLVCSPESNYVFLYERGSKGKVHKDPQIEIDKDEELMLQRIADFHTELEIENKKLDDLTKMMQEQSDEYNKNIQQNIKNREYIQSLSNESIEILFDQNRQYLGDIYNGIILNARHEAFFQCGKARHDLLYKVNIHPFTDAHFNYVMDKMNKIWVDKDDYLYKVLVPEAFTKFYMDIFDLLHIVCCRF